MPSTTDLGWWRPDDRIGLSWKRLSANSAAQPLRHVKQRLVVLHQMLGAVEARHRACCELAAQAERDEAIENRLIVLAEQPLVIVRPDSEIERPIATSGIMIDDVAHQ